MKNRIHILGVPLDPLTVLEALNALLSFARSNTQYHVITPNPEMIVEAQKNPPFMALLQKTALNLPDGSGLLLAARMKGKRIPERVTGVDMVERLSMQEHIGPIFFLGAQSGVAEKAVDTLRKKNPSLRCAGCYAGSPSESSAEDIIDRINRSGATILFVAFGAPMQDLWIDRYRAQMLNVKLAMGVGGAFDFIAGVRSRAPIWMQKIGLEWLWRLIQEPRRFMRIVRAVIVFPLLTLLKRDQPSM